MATMAAPMTGSPFWSTTRPPRDAVVTCAVAAMPANIVMNASTRLLKGFLIRLSCLNYIVFHFANITNIIQKHNKKRDPFTRGPVGDADLSD